MPWVLKEPRVKNPRGGWRFVELGKEVTATTPGDLAIRIARMRRLNNMYIGDPMSEIASGLAITDPWMVRYVPDDKSDSGANVARPEREYENWLFEYLRREVEFVHQFDAKSRAKICEGCPHNTQPEFSCGESESRYERVLMIASQGKCRNHEKLGFCNHWKHDNRLAVQINNPQPSAGCCGSQPIPDKCWM